MTDIISAESGNLTEWTDYSYGSEFKSVSSVAKINFINASEVDNITLGENINIKENGNEVFSGEVVKTDKPRDGIRTVVLHNDFNKLFGYQCNGRSFFDTDAGTIMTKLISENIQIDDPKVQYDGTTTSPITTSGGFDYAELSDFRQISIADYGSDLYQAAIAEDDGGNFSITIDNVNLSSDELNRLNFRYIINNKGSLIQQEVEYRINDKNYVWSLGKPDAVNDLTLRPENAQTEPKLVNNTQLTTNGKLQLRLETDQLPEARAVAIDGIETISTTVKSRDTDFTTIDIPDTGRKITRKFENSVADALYDITRGESAEIITSGDTIKLKDRFASQSDVKINNQTDIIDIDTNANINSIVNRVVVQGDGFTIARKEPNSIEFYDVINTKTIKDLSIKNIDDAEATAREFLRKNAFVDTEIEVTVPRTDIIDRIEVGDEIPYNLDKSGKFLLTEYQRNRDNTVVLYLDVPESRIS